MRIAIIGAGALGRIYGTRLAERHDVCYVVRAHALADSAPMRIELAGGLRRGHATEHTEPKRVLSAPSGTDVAIITLRFDSLAEDSDELREALTLPPGTMPVLLSPVFGPQRERVERLCGRRVTSGMPGVTGYVTDEGVVRYWVPVVASTVLDDGSAELGSRAEIARNIAASEEVARREQLAQALTKVGLPARLEARVAALNEATTTAFFPLIAAVAAGGSVDEVLSQRDLLALTLEAARECDLISQEIGHVATWAGVLRRFVGPMTVKAGVGLARRIAPESVEFVDRHFGPKLRAQHVAMGDEIIALAKARGLGAEALSSLVERLR